MSSKPNERWWALPALRSPRRAIRNPDRKATRTRREKFCFNHALRTRPCDEDNTETICFACNVSTMEVRF